MNSHRRTWVAALLTVLLTSATPRAGQSSDDAVMTQFQRAADAYAFQHRQIERRAGDSPDQPAIAAAIRQAQAVPAEGALFTPTAAAAFRARIAGAMRRPGCSQPVTSSAVVPRANDDARGTAPIATCVSATLPRLPEELAYRAAGVAMVLVDTHANLVVDVLHGAFPPSPAPMH